MATTIDRSELALVWPAELFATEARALLAAGYTDESSLGLLLDEAFADERAFKLFRSLQPFDPPRAGDPWAEQLKVDDPWAFPEVPAGVQLVQDLIADADAGRLHRYEPRRYWSSRRRPVEPPRLLDLDTLKSGYADLLAQLDRAGYLDDAFGSSCSDGRGDRDAAARRCLAVQLRRSATSLWPLRVPAGAPWEEQDGIEQLWSEDQFFDLVEVIHDLVARPRRRSWHGFCEEWDYDDFIRAPGQAVYRWKVNELLARSELDLRLAADGEDAGFLVHTTGDDRDHLISRVLTTPDPQDATAAAHAVKLFRARLANREDKRSAVVALARLLEDRRKLLKAELLSRDEGALFQIANRFDIRHRDGKQQRDYDEAFLDWVFWWYLATVELTDRLLALRP